MRRALAAGMIVLLFWGRLACADILKRSPSDAVCRLESVGDLMLGFRDNHCLSVDSINFFGVQEGADALLHHALRLVQNNPHQYAAVLFYAPWCPFSRAFQPSFSLLSSLYPTIPHFSIKESVLRPSTLSKYGVHGFPSLYLLNSTMRVNYHGSRNLTSVLAFYKEVTGLESTTRALEGTTLEEIKDPSNLSGKHINVEDEIYLALATIFVLTRLIYFLYPTVLVCGQCFVNYMRSMSFLGSLEHFLGYLQQATVHSSSNSTYCTRMESRKRSNFQEGAMNARVWASKSLATVSTIGETSTNSSR